MNLATLDSFTELADLYRVALQHEAKSPATKQASASAAAAIQKNKRPAGAVGGGPEGSGSSAKV